MDKKNTVSYCLKQLTKSGADKATCTLNMNEKKELNVEVGKMSLLRTTFNSQIGISVIKDNKQAATSINETDTESIDVAACLLSLITEIPI
jgi:predicted Zn-dependent protease